MRLVQRLTIAIFCADYLTMFAMNCLRLRPHAVPWLLLPSVLVSFLLTRGMFSAAETTVLTQIDVKKLIVLALGVGIACAGIRWAYLVQPMRHSLACVVGDDAWHLQELNSLVNSPAYPARSSFAPQNYLSFYYAAWMPAVALYFAVPLPGMTVSVALFWVNALYDILLPVTLLGVALPMARSKRQMMWAVYLVGFWSGVQSAYALRHPFLDTTWPLYDVFGLRLQYSNFVTLMVWVVHHLCAAVALLLANALWRQRAGWRQVAICSLLLVFSIYSSVFVFLGTLPFVIYRAIQSLRERRGPVVGCTLLSSALAFPLLWMFLRKPGAVAFQLPLQQDRWITIHRWLGLPQIHWQLGYVAGIALFLVLLTAQLCFVLWALWRGRNSLTVEQRVLTAIAATYLLSTYFVGFSAANNYCLRGSIVPVVVLCWIASAHLPAPRGAVALLVLAGSLGTWQTLEYHLLRSVALYVKPRPYLAKSNAVLKLNRDRSRTQVDLLSVPGVREFPADLPYYIEKMPLRPWPVVALPDTELQTSGPYGPWAWQRR